MPPGPAARITDPVSHLSPPVLTGGPGSVTVLIGALPAWRGIPMAAAAAIQSAKATSDTAIQTAEAATVAAAGTPGLPAAKLAEETTKATAATQMGSLITSSAGGADLHACLTPLPLPPHGPGVVVNGSQTVLINNLPSCRAGDTIVEAVGPPNTIVLGCPTVIIGDSGTGNSGGAMVAAKVAGAPFAPTSCPEQSGNSWQQNVEDPAAKALDDVRKGMSPGLGRNLYDAAVGVGKGAYGFVKDTLEGVGKAAKFVGHDVWTDPQTRDNAWNAVKQGAKDSATLQFGSPEEKYAVAKKYGDMAKKAAEKVANDLKKEYEQAEKDGKESEMVAKNVTKMGLTVGSLFLGGEAAEAASAADKAEELAQAGTKAEGLLNSGRVSDSVCPTCPSTVKGAESAAPLASSSSPVRMMSPNDLRFSQRSAGGSGRAAPLRESMKGGWNGPPVDAVETPDGVVTIDNTRIAVARELGLKEVPVTVHPPSESLPKSMLGRFGDAKTWGEALAQRTGKQRPPLPLSGTPDAPRMPK